MKISKIAVAISVVVSFSSVLAPINAQSEEVPARGPIPFAAYDKDGNGLVSEEEFNTVRGERMATRAAEGRPMRGAASAPAFSAFDTNSDGQLSQHELLTGQRKQMEERRGMGMGMGQGRGMGKGMGMGRNMPDFAEFDLNGDGKLLEKEFYEARSKRISERAQQGYQMRNLGNAPSFTDIDTNKDGEISADEFAAHQSQHRQQRAQ